MSIFSDALDWAAGGIDELLGYSNSFTAAGPMLPGSIGPATSFLTGAYDVVSAITDSGIGKAVGSYLDATNEKGYQGFQAPQMTGASARTPAGSANFGASKSQAMKVGLADQRVQAAYNRVRQSNNPSINAAFNMVRPTIRSGGVTTSLSSATITRRKKKA